MPIYETVTYKNGKLYQNNKIYTGNNEYFRQIESTLNSLKTKSPLVEKIINKLEEPGKVHKIMARVQDIEYNQGLDETKRFSTPTKNGGSYIQFPKFNSTIAEKDTKYRVYMFETLAHELKHSYDSHINKQKYKIGDKIINRHDRIDENGNITLNKDEGVEAWEIEAVQIGNEIRNAELNSIKTNYGGNEIHPNNAKANSTTLSNND